MGIFEAQEIKKYINLDEYPICVETGTNLGLSTDNLMHIFEKVYTIEIMEDLYNNVKKKYEDSNVECILGDSAEKIKDLVKKIDRPCLFFLDSHYSGHSGTNWNRSFFKGYMVDGKHIDTGYRGEKTDKPTSQQQTPLKEEIAEINENFPHKCVIYIDDMDKFDSETGEGLKNKGFLGEFWNHLNINDIIKGLKFRLIQKERFGTQLILVLAKK